MGATLIGLSNRRTLTFWDVSSGKKLREQSIDGISRQPEDTAPSFAQTLPDGKTFAIDHKWECLLVDAESGKIVGRHGVDPASHDWQKALPVMLGRIPMSALPNGSSYRIKKGEAEWADCAGEDYERVRQGLCTFSPDGKRFAGLFGTLSMVRGPRVRFDRPPEKALVVWDLTAKKELCRMDKVDGSRLVFSPDGGTLAVDSPDKIILIDSTTGKRLPDLPGRHGPPMTRRIAISGDGALLASASGDRCVHIWDLKKFARLHDSEEIGETAAAVAFSPNGQVIATAGVTGVLRFWDADSGRISSPDKRERRKTLGVHARRQADHRGRGPCSAGRKWARRASLFARCGDRRENSLLCRPQKWDPRFGS